MHVLTTHMVSLKYPHSTNNKNKLQDITKIYVINVGVQFIATHELRTAHYSVRDECHGPTKSWDWGGINIQPDAVL